MDPQQQQQYQTPQVILDTQGLLDKAKNVLVVSHENPTQDSIGSMLSMYLGLAALGKNVTVALPEPVKVELSNYIGVDKITSDIGQKNFVISLDYKEGSIEKVSYNIEGSKFNLVVEHRAGYEPFKADQARYSYTGAHADVIFTIDTIHLGGLKKLYENNKDTFASIPIVNIDYHPNNTQYGKVNIVDTQASSTAELVATVLSYLGVDLSQDIATNLLNAVYAATRDFQDPNTTATAFEVASICLRGGGKRFGDTQKVVSQPFSTPEPVTPPSPVPVAVPKMQPQAVKPSSAPKQSPQANAPDDWLKPKIFRSSGSMV